MCIGIPICTYLYTVKETVSVGFNDNDDTVITTIIIIYIILYTYIIHTYTSTTDNTICPEGCMRYTFFSIHLRVLLYMYTHINMTYIIIIAAM